VTVKDIIKKAMMDIGAIASGEVPTAAEINDGLDALNLMLGEWNSVESGIPYSREVSHALTVGDYSYTVGPSGNFDAQRPERIAGAFLRDASDNDTPIKVLTAREEYDGIGNKTAQGSPDRVFYDPTWPTGTLLVWPVPNAALALHLLIPEPFTKLTSLTTDLTTVFPPGYEAAIRWNLGFELCPMYGKSISPEHLGKARASRDKLVSVNFSRTVAPVDVAGQVGAGSTRFDILNAE
jgi:hypothetical protein